MGLFFKKLIAGSLFGLVCAMIYYIVWLLFATYLNTFTGLRSEFLKTLLVLSVPLFVVARFTYTQRVKLKEQRRDYLSSLKTRKFNLPRELMSTLKSPEYIAELCACATVLIILVISFYFNRSEYSFWDKVRVIIYTFARIYIGFAVMDYIVWIFVRFAWFRSRAF